MQRARSQRATRRDGAIQTQTQTGEACAVVRAGAPGAPNVCAVRSCLGMRVKVRFAVTVACACSKACVTCTYMSFNQTFLAYKYASWRALQLQPHNTGVCPNWLHTAFPWGHSSDYQGTLSVTMCARCHPLVAQKKKKKMRSLEEIVNLNLTREP